MKSIATKILKNSIYGSFGTTNEPEDMYCAYCHSKIDHWFMDNPLGCFKCDKGKKSDAKIITKQEMRECKFKQLGYEH